MHIFWTYCIWWHMWRYNIYPSRHITDFELITFIMHLKKKVIIPRLEKKKRKTSTKKKQITEYVFIHQVIPPERFCSWNGFDSLFMRQHDVFMFLFIYLFLKSALYSFWKKRVWIWGNWKSCTKCSETNRLKWSKMPTCSDWLQPERYRKMQLFYLVDLFFICIKLLQWPRKCKKKKPIYQTYVRLWILWMNKYLKKHTHKKKDTDTTKY